MERTADGHYVIVDGRRWRATDPSIPDGLRNELVAELMAARRAVKTDPDGRGRVQDAKLALGERGELWWETATESGRDKRLAATIRALLRHRDPDRTICPSDVARVVGGTRWRQLLEYARSVAAELHDQRIVQIRQRGKEVDPRSARGPIRIGRGPNWSP